MADNNISEQYRKSFTNPSITIGTITVALAITYALYKAKIIK